MVLLLGEEYLSLQVAGDWENTLGKASLHMCPSVFLQDCYNWSLPKMA